MIEHWNTPIATTQERILPIGYTEPDAEQRIAEFLATSKKHGLVDIRLKPRSRWYQNFNLKALDQRYGVQYGWCPELGNLNHKPADRHKGIMLKDPEAGLRKVTSLLEQGYSIMLLCACKDYEQCHRKVVHEMLIQALAAIEWRKERRRLFLSLMRRPEMRLVRLALRSINWCAGLDWRELKEVWIDPSHDLKACWSLDTPEYFVHCICPDANPLTYDDFELWYRCTGEPGCQCYFCSYPRLALNEQEAIQDETAQFKDGLFMHIENAEGKRIV